MKKTLFYLLLISNTLFAQSNILIMSPEPNSTISGKDVLIAISMYKVSGGNSDLIQLLLDGEDITDLAYVDSEMVSCLLDELEPGDHQVQLFTGRRNPKSPLRHTMRPTELPSHHATQSNLALPSTSLSSITKL